MPIIARANPGDIRPIGSLARVRNQTEVSSRPLEGLADAVSGLADTGLKIYQQQQDRADAAAIMEADRKLSDWQNSWGDPNNPEGMSAYKGREALGLRDAMLPDFERVAGEIESSLPSERARLKFRASATVQRDQVQRQINNYANAQNEAFMAAESKAWAETTANDLINSELSGEPDRTALQWGVALDRIVTEGAANGRPANETQLRVQALKSSVRAGVISQKMVADPVGAQAYFVQHRDELLPEQRAQIEAKLYPLVEDSAAERIAGSILAGGFEEADDPDSVDGMIVGLESGGEAGAKNPNSSAAGAGQFIDSTWLQMIRRHRPDLAQGRSEAEILAMKGNGDLSRQMVTAYRKDNAAHLQAAGVQTTATNLYAAHHFGPAGAVRFARADADTPMTAILSKGEIAANPYLQGKTVGDVKANWQRRGLQGGAQAGQPTAPPTSAAEALARAQSIRDPRLRAAVTSKLKTEYALRDMQEAADNKARTERVTQAINASPGTPLAKVLDPADYAKVVADGDLAKWDNYRTTMATQGFVQDDVVLVDQLERQAATDPAAFIARDINALAPQLSTGTLSRLLKMQADGKKDPSKQADWATEADRLNTGLAMLGLDKSGDVAGKGSEKKNAPREQQRGQFRAAYQQSLAAFIQQNGKKPTPEQADVLVRATARQFAERMAEERTGIYTGAAAFSLQISEADRAAVRNAYRDKYGSYPTDAWVTQYVARQRAPAHD